MAWYYNYNHGESIYVTNGDPRFNRDGIFYQDPAPVSFRTPPFYNDVYYRRSFSDLHPHFSHGGELIPASEQVHIRREDPYRYPYPTPTPTEPWWLNRDYPHYGGYYDPIWVVARPHRDDDHEDSNLVLYTPQLYSHSRRRKVVDALRRFLVW